VFFLKNEAEKNSDLNLRYGAVAAHLIGIDPATVGHFRLAKDRDIGEIDVKKIETNADLRRCRRKFRLPSSVVCLRTMKIQQIPVKQDLS